MAILKKCTLRFFSMKTSRINTIDLPPILRTTDQEQMNVTSMTLFGYHLGVECIMFGLFALQLLLLQQSKQDSVIQSRVAAFFNTHRVQSVIVIDTSLTKAIFIYLGVSIVLPLCTGDPKISGLVLFGLHMKAIAIIICKALFSLVPDRS